MEKRWLLEIVFLRLNYRTQHATISQDLPVDEIHKKVENYIRTQTDLGSNPADKISFSWKTNIQADIFVNDARRCIAVLSSVVTL